MAFVFKRESSKNSIILHRCEVHTDMEIIFKDPPKTCKELYRYLDVIKDYKQGLERNQGIVRFLFGITGYVLKFDAQHSHYQTYKAKIDGIFDLGFIKSEPLLPLDLYIFLEDKKVNPDCLITFRMTINYSTRSPDNLVAKLIQAGPKKYKKRSAPQLKYLEPLGVLCSTVGNIITFQEKE